MNGIHIIKIDDGEDAQRVGLRGITPKLRGNDAKHYFPLEQPVRPNAKAGLGKFTPGGLSLCAHKRQAMVCSKKRLLNQL